MKNSVSLLLICLNEEAVIDDCLKSLKYSKYDELVIVDGGSTDKTISICKKYKSKIIFSSPSMTEQLIKGLNIIESKYVILIETDHVYPKNFVSDFLNLFLKSNIDAGQSKLNYKPKYKTFFNLGHKVFYEVHNSRKNIEFFLQGGSVWKTEEIKNIMNKMSTKGYGMDTERSEIIREKKLKVKYLDIFVEESGTSNFEKFISRMRNYGKGDYEFYKNNSKSWGLKRKAKSLTHVFFRYCINYPIISIFKSNPLIGIPYFYLIAIFRYYYWIKSYFINK